LRLRYLHETEKHFLRLGDITNFNRFTQNERNRGYYAYTVYTLASNAVIRPSVVHLSVLGLKLENSNGKPLAGSRTHWSPYRPSYLKKHSPGGCTIDMPPSNSCRIVPLCDVLFSVAREQSAARYA